MSYLQHQLRSEPLTAVFDIVKRVFTPALVSYLITNVITLIVFVPIFLSLFGIDMDTIMQLAQSTNPIAQQEMIQSLLEDNFMGAFQNPLTWVLFGAAILFSFVIGAWSQNVLLVSNELAIKGHRPQLSQVLKEGFNSNLPWLILAYILVMLILALAGFAAGALSTISGWLAVPLFLMVGFLAMRFLLVFPSIVHGGMSVGQSISHSFRVIGWGRGAKYFGAAILFFLSLMVVALLMAMIQGALGFIPVLGVVLSFAVQLFFSAMLTALMIATLSGLYYRHSEDLPSDEDGVSLEDHLLA